MVGGWILLEEGGTLEEGWEDTGRSSSAPFSFFTAPPVPF